MASIKRVQRLSLVRMFKEPFRYSGLADGLASLPCPAMIRIGRKEFSVPGDLKEFSENICYGQRGFFVVEEPIDIGLILRYISCYFYPGEWDEKKSIKFARYVLGAKVVELYPVTVHLVKLMGELVEREQKLLYRKPSKQEVEAGIDKLSKFGALTSLLFLMDSFKATEREIELKPYNECLTRFMLQKEQNAYAERLAEVYRNEQKNKKK